jgi:hypothetical protein
MVINKRKRLFKRTAGKVFRLPFLRDIAADHMPETGMHLALFANGAPANDHAVFHEEDDVGLVLRGNRARGECRQRGGQHCLLQDFRLH